MAREDSDRTSEIQDSAPPAHVRAKPHLGRREYQRAYKACIPCRKRKAKCDLGGDESPVGPPCARCRRELRECVFTTERPWTKRQKHERVGLSEGVNGDTVQAQALASVQHPTDLTSREDQLVATNGDANHYLRRVNGTDLTSPGALDSCLTPQMPNYDGIGPHPAMTNEGASLSQPARQSASMTGHAGGLTSSVMRTVVSNGNDALNLLFEAANHEDSNSDGNFAAIGQPAAEICQQYSAAELGNYGTPGSTMSFGTGPAAANAVRLSVSSSSVLKVWDACRFVKMGWMVAEEAVTYVDLFYKNLSPLSPILTDFYCDHSNHYLLVTQEPLLCCAILMISSRYHVLPGVGGASRGYFIHHRLWEHCQHLIMRVMLGQEKGSKAKTRTVGTLEALLLMCEWQPRALHFPPANDGWDSDLILTVADDRDERRDNSKRSDRSRARWLEDVIEPARRSDRMSWMLSGCAMSLAHELGVFDDDSKRPSVPQCESRSLIERTAFRRKRIRKLLYVFTEQLASRLGCTSMIPQSLNHTVLGGLSSGGGSRATDQWHTFMSAWIELTKLVKSVSDMLFPSASFTQQLLRTGRYIGLLEHFRPLLTQWQRKHLDPHYLRDSFQDMLSIEYQYVRIYTNSLGMQAVVERTLADSDAGTSGETLPLSLDAADYEFTQEVVDGSCEILQKVIKLADSGALRFSPVRIFLRITNASIFLLKGLSLGVWTTKLQASLNILDRGIQAMKSSTLDDMHLASRYATLLELHVARLRKSFIVSTKPPKLATRPSSIERQLMSDAQGLNSQSNATPGTINFVADNATCLLSSDDWLTLPFDPSLAPFGSGDSQAFAGLDDSTLNFLWDLPT